MESQSVYVFKNQVLDSKWIRLFECLARCYGTTWESPTCTKYSRRDLWCRSAQQSQQFMKEGVFEIMTNAQISACRCRYLFSGGARRLGEKPPTYSITKRCVERNTRKNF